VQLLRGLRSAGDLEVLDAQRDAFAAQQGVGPIAGYCLPASPGWCRLIWPEPNQTAWSWLSPPPIQSNGCTHRQLPALPSVHGIRWKSARLQPRAEHPGEGGIFNCPL